MEEDRRIAPEDALKLYRDESYERGWYFFRDEVPVVEHFPANHAGRDFVVGDLHGCLAQLETLLRAVEFDPAVDRLFAVGDLVDRGPESMACLALLEQPWFHAVMGNHEQLMLGFLLPWLKYGVPPDPESDAGILFHNNGGAWAWDEIDQNGRPSPDLDRLLRCAYRLPLVMVVGQGRERFNVVHADLHKTPKKLGEPGVWVDAELDALCRWSVQHRDYPGFRWSRQIMEYWQRTSVLRESQQGLSTTFCGHTIAPFVRSVMSHVCLDTGAFMAHRKRKFLAVKEYGLTLADVRERRLLTLRSSYIEEANY